MNWFTRLFSRKREAKPHRTYPKRTKEPCKCGRMITKCVNGKFVRHNCNPIISDAEANRQAERDAFSEIPCPIGKIAVDAGVADADRVWCGERDPREPK